MDQAVWTWTAWEIRQAVVAGRITARAALEAVLERQAAVNPGLNAVVEDLSAPARQAADALDAARAAGGPIGALYGVPVTVKINVDVKGSANSNGLAALATNIAAEDSPVVANLRRAGAVVFGLTNTPEFSLRVFTDNPLHGQTRNPWSPDVTCGGSSGGAGAAVAAGIGPLGHGNDIGGSLRWPAFCNGIYALKPTQGRIPSFSGSATRERGLVSTLMSAQGPLARCVEDLQLGLAAMSAFDPRDPLYAPAPLEGPPVANPLAVARAKIPDGFSPHPEILAVLDDAERRLTAAGYHVETVEVPDILGVWRLWADLLVTDIDKLSLSALEAIASPAFKGYVDNLMALGSSLDGLAYLEALADRTRRLREWMMFLERWPVILAPVSLQPTPPPGADLEGRAAVERIFRDELLFTPAINGLGLPSVACPIGFAGGAPAGVQLIASRFREDLCLRAAAALQAHGPRLHDTLWEQMAGG